MDTLIFLVIIISPILCVGFTFAAEHLLALIGCYYLYLSIRAFLNKPNWSLKRSIKFTERKYIIDDRKKYLKLEGAYNLLTGVLFISNTFIVKFYEDILCLKIMIVVLAISVFLYYFLLNKLLERKSY